MEQKIIKGMDFRIGNFIYDERGQITQVINFDYEWNPVLGDVYLILGLNGVWCHWKGVELTEDILIRFGAKIEQGIGYKYYCFRDYDVRVDLVKRLCYVCRYDEDAVGFPCKYIHQLQNIYYALTGDELILK